MHFYSEPCFYNILILTWFQAAIYQSKIFTSEFLCWEQIRMKFWTSNSASVSNILFLVLSIDPLTGRIKSEHEFSDENGMMFGAPQEGLTPHHLKKAKLMFFYCRYPSSNVLKTFFPDVKVIILNFLTSGILTEYKWK